MRADLESAGFPAEISLGSAFNGDSVFVNMGDLLGEDHNGFQISAPGRWEDSYTVSVTNDDKDELLDFPNFTSALAFVKSRAVRWPRAKPL